MKSPLMFLCFALLGTSFASATDRPPMGIFHDPAPDNGCASRLTYLDPFSGIYKVRDRITIELKFVGNVLEMRQGNVKREISLDGTWKAVEGGAQSEEERGFAIGNLVVIQKRYKGVTSHFEQMALLFQSRSVDVDRLHWTGLDGLKEEEPDYWVRTP